MPRELRIMATITLPDDMEERAEAIVALKPALAMLRQHFGDKVQMEEGEAETPRQRRPRKPRLQPVEPVSTSPREAA